MIYYILNQIFLFSSLRSRKQKYSLQALMISLLLVLLATTDRLVRKMLLLFISFANLAYMYIMVRQ